MCVRVQVRFQQQARSPFPLPCKRSFRSDVAAALRPTCKRGLRKSCRNCIASLAEHQRFPKLDPHDTRADLKCFHPPGIQPSQARHLRASNFFVQPEPFKAQRYCRHWRVQSCQSFKYARASADGSIRQHSYVRKFTGLLSSRVLNQA